MPWQAAESVGVALFSRDLVLDIDVKNGARGPQALLELEAQLGPLPATRRQSTPSGGWHLLFDIGHLSPLLEFTSHVASVDDLPSNIDIVHAGNRYLEVYEEGFFLDESVPIAVLPDGWLPVLLRRGVAPTAEKVSKRVRRAAPADVVAAIANAAVGTRNQTLNDEVFGLALRRQLDEDLLTEIQDAAHRAGLPVSEIDDTVRSAVTGARRARRDVDTWLEAVDAHLDGGSRRALRLGQAARFLADLKVAVAHDRPVDLSVRELALGIGTSVASASGYLNELCEEGLLERMPPSRIVQAASFDIRSPSTDHALRIGDQDELGNGWNPNLNTLPSSSLQLEHLAVASSTTTAGAQGLLMERAGDLLAHDAFRPGPRRLPPSSALMLAALGTEPMSRSEVEAVTSLSTSTVRRVLMRLVRDGVVDEVAGRYRLDGSPAELPDDWASRNGADGRRDVQAEAFREQRQQFADLRQRTAPPLDRPLLQRVRRVHGETREISSFSGDTGNVEETTAREQ